MNIGAWLWAVFVSLDQMVNTLTGPVLNRWLEPEFLFGYPDETLSSVLGKNVRRRACRFCTWVCALLQRLDPNHCAKSIEDDEGNRDPSINK